MYSAVCDMKDLGVSVWYVIYPCTLFFVKRNRVGRGVSPVLVLIGKSSKFVSFSKYVILLKIIFGTKSVSNLKNKSLMKETRIYHYR